MSGDGFEETLSLVFSSSAGKVLSVPAVLHFIDEMSSGSQNLTWSFQQVALMWALILMSHPSTATTQCAPCFCVGLLLTCKGESWISAI